MRDVLEKIFGLFNKMQLYKAIISSGTDTGEMKNRELLLLEVLAEHGQMSVTELCGFLPGVAQSTISGDIKRLRNDMGLVRKDLGEDERTRLVSLTEQGLAKVEEAKRQRISMFAPLHEALGQDPEELEAIRRVVLRTIEKLDVELARHRDSSL